MHNEIHTHTEHHHKAHHRAPLVSLKHLIGETIPFVRKHIHVLAFIAIIPIVFSGVTGAVALGIGHGLALTIIAGVCTFVFGVLTLFFNVVSPLVLAQAVDTLKKGEHFELSAEHLTKVYRGAMKLFFPYIWVLILTFFASMGGTVLLIIPGIIISFFLAFSIFTFTLEGKRGMKTLVTSVWHIRGRAWEVFGKIVLAAIAMLCASGISYLLVDLVISKFLHLDQSVVSFLNDVIVNVFIFPFMFTFMYMLYKDLVRTSHGEIDHVFAEKTRFWLTASMVLAIAVFVVSAIVIIVINF